jgi:hypothetical protein
MCIVATKRSVTWAAKARISKRAFERNLTWATLPAPEGNDHGVARADQKCPQSATRICATLPEYGAAHGARRGCQPASSNFIACEGPNRLIGKGSMPNRKRPL